MMPKVSIIVPIYNVEKYLERCLHSLVNQTLQDIEIICVNDGSPDQSQQIVDQFALDYPGKVIPVQKKNGGLADARNYGLNYVNGDYLLFIDSDDWIEAQMCETMYRTAISESADLVVCDIQNVYEDGHVAYVSCGDFKEGNIKTLPYLLTIDNSACNKLFKKTLFEDIKFPLGIWYEDLGCIPIVLSKAQRVVKVNKAFYNYFQREGSIINTYSEKSLDIYKALQLIDSYYNGKYRSEVEFLYIKNLMLYGCSRHLTVKNGEAYMDRAVDFMKERFPFWLKNPYVKSFSFKDRFILWLYSVKRYRLVRMLLSIKQSLKGFSK